MANFLSKLFKGTPQKQAVLALGGYEAAAWTRDRSTIYPVSATEQANPSSYTRAEIVRLTRYLVSNYPLAERILTVAEIYAIGAGLYANGATHDSGFNDDASAAFDLWGNNCFCASNNAYNLYEMQRLVVRELLIAGEVFIVLIKTPSGYPQLMLVPSENVRHSGEEKDKSVDGLYVDDYGKVTAYNVYTGNYFQKIEAGNVVHIMRHKQIGQLRGIGGFAASLNAMRDHKDCMTLEKKAVKVHSTLAAVVERAGGEAGTGGIFGEQLPGVVTTPPAPASANVGLERAFGGAVAYLEKGEKVNLISSDRSTSGFMAFLEMLVRDVCLNISIPYEFLVNADKLSGTGVRFALGDADAFFKNLQNMLIDGALQRIYAWVIASLINDGKLDAPANGELPWNVTFTRPISITVDLQRASNVEISLLQNSLLTYEAYYSARGKDWKAELRQHAKEEQFLDTLAAETGVSISRLRALAAGSPAIASPEQDTTPETAKEKAA